MTGFQELLLLTAISLAIFALPRVMRPRRPKRMQPFGSAIKGPLRLAVLASLLWLGLSALWFKPWTLDFYPFLYVGLAPVVAGWGVKWVLDGYRQKRR